MLYFFLIVIIFMVLDFFVKKEKTKNRLFILLMIILTFFACFRSYEVGTDTGLYWSDYSKIVITPFKQLNFFRYELGFCVFCKILSLITNNPQILIVVTGLLINAVVTYFIYTNSKNKLSTAIFYFTTNYYFIFLCLMRQALALCFIMLGYNFLKKDKKFLYYLMVFFAFLFHSSSIIFVLLPFFKNKKLSRYLPLNIMIFSLLSLIAINPVFMIITKMGFYSKYINSSFVSSSFISAGLYSLSSFCFFLFGFIIPSKDVINNEYNKEPNFGLLTWIMAIGTIISFASMRISIINRLYLYFGFFAALWLSQSLELLRINNNKVFWKIILYLTTLCYVYVITKLDWFGIFPYNFY